MTNQSRPATGYSMWRLIAEELRRGILNGHWAPGDKLPSEHELAAQFDVHRNTVRQAVANLAADDLLVLRRGSGTFVADHAVVVHRIGTRTRLTESIGSSGTVSGRLIEAVLDPEPPADVARRLNLEGRATLRLELVRSLDGVPIVRATKWFVAELVPGLGEHFRAAGTITAALSAAGIADYLRISTTMSARHATRDESADLQLSGGAVLMVVRALDVLPDHTPLQDGISRFAASRVELDLEHEAGEH